MKFLLAKKLGMTTVYKKDEADNVTLLEVGKNVVTGVRNKEKDGYEAVQVGLEKSKKSKNPERKQASNGARDKVYEVVREFKVDDTTEFKQGDEVKIDQFKEGDKVAVKGISKGKGFQGVVKRHGFKGGPASHGHRHNLRGPGAIGSAFPERVMKGKKMAGRMGNQGVTTNNMRISLVDTEKRIVAVKGAVPGTNGSLVVIYSE